MMGEPVPPARWTQPPEADPGARAVRPDTGPLRQGLERLRENVLQRLDQLEALVRDRRAAPPAEEWSSERAEEEALALDQRAAALEDAQRRLRAESERWTRERQAALEQLEHDRKLLAESWERLEREQIETPATHGPATAAHPAAPVRPRAGSDSGHDDPVAQDMLRQFQALRRDVRRNANGQRSG